MKFNPRNRFILVSEVETKNENEIRPAVLLPDGYAAKSNPYGVYQIQQFFLGWRAS